MKKILERVGPQGRVKPNDHDCLNVLREDCICELHDSSEQRGALHHFLPIGGLRVTLRCHGTDTFLGEGLKETVITRQQVHSVLADEGGWRLLFPMEHPVTESEPESEPYPLEA